MFKFNILTRFLLRRFFTSFGLVMMVLCGIILAVTFVERLPSNPTALMAISESWTRLLEYVPLFLPMAVFMGTLMATYNLTKSSESIIVSSAGMSPYQSAKPFLIGAVIVGIFATLVINPYAVNLSMRNITPHQLKLIDNSIWLRDANNNGTITLTAKNMTKDQDALNFQDAVVYVQNSDFKLTNRIETKNITLNAAGFQTDKATIWNQSGNKSTDSWQIATQLTPSTVLDRYLQPDQISFWQLPEFIQRMDAVGIPVRGHWVQLWTLICLPLTLLAMATLGIAFSQTRQRRNYSFGIKFSLGILTCFAVYFLVNMFNALGATGALPALLAIIAPPLIIIAGAGIFITTFDTI